MGGTSKCNTAKRAEQSLRIRQTNDTSQGGNAKRRETPRVEECAARGIDNNGVGRSKPRHVDGDERSHAPTNADAIPRLGKVIHTSVEAHVSCIERPLEWIDRISTQRRNNRGIMDASNGFKAANKARKPTVVFPHTICLDHRQLGGDGSEKLSIYV